MEAHTEQLRQHEQWKAARQRLNGTSTATPTNVVSIPTLAPPTERPAEDMMDVVIAAVANSGDLMPTDVLAGVATSAVISARRLAMALSVRYAHLSFGRVATYFEVPQEAVQDAVGALDPILTQFVITSRTPIELSMPIINQEWQNRTGWLRPSHREIQGAVSEVFKISRVDMLSARRTPAAVVARHAAMAICKRMTLMSLPQIGRKFGGRDHTTVLHAVRKFQPLMDICDQTLTTTNPPHEWARMLYELVGSVPFGEGKNRRAPRV